MKAENIIIIFLISIALFTINASILFPEFVISKIVRPVIDREPEDIVNLMISCESSGNPNAYNPHDVDGKPRYGILQFSRATWTEQERFYHLHGNIWNADDQETLAVLMVRDGKAGRWGCFYKI